MAKQRKTGAAELVALVAIGTVLHDGETYLDGEVLTVDADTAARLIEVGGAKPEGEAPAEVAPEQAAVPAEGDAAGAPQAPAAEA